MQIKLRETADMATLISRQPALQRLAGLHARQARHRIWRFVDGTQNNAEVQIVHIAFIGKSGYGKSSLINTLIGKPVMATDAVEACTRVAQNASFHNGENAYLAFADVPGIGESADRDTAYLHMYETLVTSADAVVYVLRADNRDYTIDLDAFTRLFPRPIDRRKVIIAVNGCDRIEPRPKTSNLATPSVQQLPAIEAKLQHLAGVFPHVRSIIPCCAEPAWNLPPLIDAICDTLHNAPGIDLPR